MAEGVVFDLGYRPHEGERLGRSGARRALYKDGVRRVLGLRRKARRKVFPIALIGTALVPALFFVALGVIAGEFDQAATLFDYLGPKATVCMHGDVHAALLPPIRCSTLPNLREAGEDMIKVLVTMSRPPSP